MNIGVRPLKFIEKTDFWLYITILASLVVGVIGSVLNLDWLGIIIPSMVIALYFLIFQINHLFKILFFLIPLSMEIELPGGLSTDLIGEPILWLLFIYTLITIIKEGVPKSIFNSISLLIILHLLWILITSILAIHHLVAFKYWLAKLWYIFPFYILPFYLIRNLNDVRVIFKYFLSGLLLAATYFFIQHYLLDLTYMSRTNAGQPIWRNHVNYACTLVIGLPMIWYVWKTSKHPDKWIYWILFGIFIVFIYFAFARIAYICMAVILVYNLILRLNVSKPIIISTIIASSIAVIILNRNNQYLHLAPDYERAIMQLDFERKITSTTTGEDISTMERIHRWVAGRNMVIQKPMTGFGPGNFYRTYRPYTLFSFETYVSDNPDRSGIHNYYLMILSEQGIPGLLIFSTILILSLVKIENYFHHFSNRISKPVLVTLGSILIMIICINSINDMIEVIKIGGIFFFVLSIIANYKYLSVPRS